MAGSSFVVANGRGAGFFYERAPHLEVRYFGLHVMGNGAGAGAVLRERHCASGGTQSLCTLTGESLLLVLYQ